jgi:hypothetical protein
MELLFRNAAGAQGVNHWGIWGERTVFEMGELIQNENGI